MGDRENLDALFQQAVSLVDAGDTAALGELLGRRPELVRERLTAPGAWLRDAVGGALEGYFKEPYLLWFVADNPIRQEKLSANIASVARVIVDALDGEKVASRQEQLDYTLGLVATGRIPRECGVQIELMDALIDAGATPGGGKGALANGNPEAARHLLKRGGKLTLAVAVCLDLKGDTERLAREADDAEKQAALTAAAMTGKAEGVTMLLGLGADINAYSTGIHPHATPLHQAVWSGSLETVKVLTAAGAKLDIRDKIYDGTPLDWAEYGNRQEIAAYLRGRTV